jgi:hypothetical protein
MFQRALGRLPPSPPFGRDFAHLTSIQVHLGYCFSTEINQQSLEMDLEVAAYESKDDHKRQLLKWVEE